MSDPRALERIGTGVPGFDTILGGGLLRGGVYIVEGPPGAGKTILANQVCFHRASLGESTVYITLLAESHSRMIAHLRSMSFFRADLVASLIYFISAFKVLEEHGLGELLKSVQQAVIARKASLVIVDGLVSVEEFAESPKAFKKFIHELQTVAGMTQSTVLLLSSTERAAGFRPEHTMVDGLVELSELIVGVHSSRQMVVRKMRGAMQQRGRHAFEVTNDGITVLPRIETTLGAPPRPVVSVPGTQRSFGIAELDVMLRGGLPAGSNTVVIGPSGAGKTLLGLQYLATGAARGEVGLYLGFYERPGALLEKGERLGLGVRAAHAAGTLHLVWEPPTEGVLDAVVARVLSLVAQHGVTRLVIDGLHGFRHHAEYPGRTRSVFSALACELSSYGVTSIFSLEATELVGPKIEAPIEGISGLADNLIVLRRVEVRARHYRLLSILKVRDQGYDQTTRQLEMSDTGIVIAPTAESADRILGGEQVPEH